MRLNQPKKKVFWITVIVAAVSAIAFIVSFFTPAFVGIIAFILMLAAFVLLALSCVLKGL
jgi:hypothetical protein